jgi:CBS domain-containing protein
VQASDVMSTSVKTVTPLMTVSDAATIMCDFDIGFLPVVDDSDRTKLLGVVTDRDLVTRALAARLGQDTTIRFVMSGPPLTIARESTDVHELLRLMERRQVRRVPIVSQDGRLRGVVSQGDLALRIGPSEPAAIEGLLERVSAPAWLLPFLDDGPVRLPRHRADG